MPRLGRTPLHEWIRQATKFERETLAAMVGRSVAYVRAIAYGDRNGSWDLVLRIAAASREIRGQSLEQAKRLPSVGRGDVSPICAACPFYQACKQAGIRESGEAKPQPKQQEGENA